MTPHNRPAWQKSLQKHVCGKMHVVMPVDTVRQPSVETAELFELASDRIRKGIGQSVVVQKARDTTRAKTFSNLLVMGGQSSWNCRCGKRSAKVQVKADVKALLPGDVRSTFRIFHENHAARRGEYTPLKTIQDSIGGSVIAAPVVGVDKETAARCRLLVKGRSRQLNLVFGLFWRGGTFTGFFGLYCSNQRSSY